MWQLSGAKTYPAGKGKRKSARVPGKQGFGSEPLQKMSTVHGRGTQPSDD